MHNQQQAPVGGQALQRPQQAPVEDQALQRPQQAPVEDQAEQRPRQAPKEASEMMETKPKHKANSKEEMPWTKKHKKS